MLFVHDVSNSDPRKALLHMLWRTGRFGDNFHREQCTKYFNEYDGNPSPSFRTTAILFNGKGWHNKEDLRTIPWNLPLEQFYAKPGKFVGTISTLTRCVRPLEASKI